MKSETFPAHSTSIAVGGRASAVNGRDWDVVSVVDRLRESREVTHSVRFNGRVRELPSRADLVAIVRNLCAALFPTHYGRHDLTDESIDFFVGATLNDAPLSLSKQICRGLQFAPDRDVESEALRAEAILATRVFAHELLEIRNVLVTDLAAAFSGDPAATSVSEILLCYRGVNAIIHHRLAHTLYPPRRPGRAEIDRRHRARGDWRRHSPRRAYRRQLFHRSWDRGRVVSPAERYSKLGLVYG